MMHPQQVQESPMQQQSPLPQQPPMQQPLPLTRVPNSGAAELRRHRLERHVARLRVARAAPSRLQLPALPLDPPTIVAVGAPPSEDAQSPEDGEAFVPQRAAPTESSRMQQAAARDRAWIADFWVELLLVLLGLNLGPLLYYYVVQRVPPIPSGHDGVTGIGYVDYWLRNAAAPLRCVQHWCNRSNLPTAVPAFVRVNGPLIALLASLAGTALLLRNKAGLVQAVRDVPRMRASTTTHLVIAWSWLSSPWTISTLFSWVTNFFGNLVGFALLVFFSHAFAGPAQGVALGYMFFLLSGLGKRLETDSFGVDVPDPDKDGGSGDKPATTGVAGGGALPNGVVADLTAAAPQEWWMAEEARDGGGVGGGGGVDGGVDVPASPFDAARLFNDTVTDPATSVAAAAATSAAIAASSGSNGSSDGNDGSNGSNGSNGSSGSSDGSDGSDGSGSGGVVTDDDDKQEEQSPLARGANRGAFQLLRVLNVTVLAVFGAVKLARAARLRTGPGRVFGLTASGLILVGSLGVGALRLQQAAFGNAEKPPPIRIYY